MDKMSSLPAVYPPREEARRNSIHFVESSTTLMPNRARAVVRCLIWTMILLFLAISLCSVMAWFILHPRVPLIQINSLCVSNFSLSEGHLRTDAEMGFVVINNNYKIDLLLSRFDVLLWYKNHDFSKSYFEPFSLQKRHETSVTVIFAANSGFNAKEEKIATEMSLDMSKKELNLNVSMEGSFSITSGKWYRESKSMEISCKDLKVQFSANGEGKLNSDQKHDCSVHFV